MATPKAAWGIEIGAYAIKAIRLEREGDSARVTDFAYIPHKKVLATPDLDQDEMIRLSLGQFISQKDLEGEHMVMSVPGHAAFARFAKLPPVEAKKIPDIVKFEAVQQIPFPIDQVEWDYQTFETPESPEVEVGIFAITRERVQERLGLYSELGVSPEALTLSPVAVYNAVSYDYDLSKHREPIIFLDIGTQATDVVIAQEERCWIRTFPLGGTHFTEAIANSFKLSYTKAEKLKCEASSSKYAKQIMQAMRPVFSDLLQDLQRSIGYFQSVHREHDLSSMIGIGSTFKIPGLRKFIGQQLQINVQRLDEYKKIQVSGRDAASFAEHAVNMPTAYGLALQGIGLAEIDANLVPVNTLREQLWHSKTKWFAAAAAIIVAGTATTLYHPLKDRGAVSGSLPQTVSSVTSTAKGYQQQYQQAQANADTGATAVNMMRLTEDREIWPFIAQDVIAALASADPQPELLTSNVPAIMSIEPDERRLLQLEKLDGQYYLGGDNGQSRRIRMTVHVKVSHEDPVAFLNETALRWLRENAEPSGERAEAPYRILPDTVESNFPQRQEFTVEDDGVEQTREGGSTGGRTGGGGLRPPSGGRGGPPGSGFGPGAGGGGLSGSGEGGLQGPGRRTPPPGGSRGAPGSGFGASSGGGPSAGGGPTLPGRRGPGGGFTGGGSQPERPDPIDTSKLDEMAPLPDAPSLFPSGSDYVIFPVTFELEIIPEDQRGAPASPQQAATDSDGDQA